MHVIVYIFIYVYVGLYVHFNISIERKFFLTTGMQSHRERESCVCVFYSNGGSWRRSIVPGSSR